ncbi:hypothetical protein BTR23_19960 [Alkalihalophilus pseudofirmus]|nr:hypothetical protein BTR23_19960 [Alkalihalophilus pseudofirmus]
MKLADCVNFLLAKTQQRVHHTFKVNLKKFSITPVQYGVLNVLWEKDGLNLTEISNALMLDNSTVTGIIDRMISSDLIVRKDDLQDRRKSLLFLTDKGKQLEEPVQDCVLDLNIMVLGNFTPEEVKIFKKMLLTLSKK